MPNPEIEAFARVLVREVRDVAISACDVALRPNAAFPVAKRWREAADTGPLDSFAKIVIADVVDQTVFQLLQAIDSGALRLSYSAEDGSTVDLTDDGRGELGGSYMGSGGWRALYSQERVVDDFSDLA